jgi:hypothetical protein
MGEELITYNNTFFHIITLFSIMLIISGLFKLIAVPLHFK